VIHSVHVDRRPNLLIEKRTLYHWAEGGDLVSESVSLCDAANNAETSQITTVKFCFLPHAC